MAEEVAQGAIHGQGLLERLGQGIDVGQNQRLIVPQLVVQLPQTTQLTQKQQQPPPQEEPTMVNDPRLEPRLRQRIQPGGKSPARSAGRSGPRQSLRRRLC